MQDNFYSTPQSNIELSAVKRDGRKWLTFASILTLAFVLLPLFQMYNFSIDFDVPYWEAYYFFIPQLVSIPICIIAIIGALRLTIWSSPLLFLVAVVGPISTFLLTSFLGTWLLTACSLVFTGILTLRMRKKLTRI